MLLLAGCRKQEQFIMRGTVLEIENGAMLVEPVEGSPELNSSDRFIVALEHMEPSPEPQVGCEVEITYDGSTMETYPAGLGNISHIKVIRK